MIVTYKDFHKLAWPLYPVKSFDWDRQDGLLFLEGKILDDTKMPGETIGIRRMQSRRRKEDLYPLRRAIMDSASLIHYKNHKFFIDTYGRMRQYNRTKLLPVKCFDIRKVDKKGNASLLWLKGVNHPITIPRPPLYDEGFARMLMLNGSPWHLYDYSGTRQKVVNRKV